MDERDAYIALNMMEQVGPVRVRALVAKLGSAAAILDGDALDLRAAAGIGKDLAEAILRQRKELDWQGEIERAEQMGVRIISFIDKDYPAPLATIHDPPLALYVKGSLDTGDRKAIAVVGTRRATHYGRDTAERFAYHLAQLGFTVVSGLAAGIDTAAHRGSLKGRGRTLAVLGSALDCLYPASNRDLAREIAERGAVLSEFRFGRTPDKTTFPMRNRIVSGLSMGVLVVEAGPSSGALITVSQALDQGRTVFAVPGRIDSRLSIGPHGLIRNGACLVTGVDDILEELECLIPTQASRPQRAATMVELGPDEQAIVAALKDGEQSIDELIRCVALPSSKVNALLIGLEMKKQLRMLPGQIVELTSTT